ncbi:rod-determining factor RdfA [Haloarcula onubensis]|uniref:Uncharacterized protein n=1 Tax=Haloarcula onubensis TaxID=2950539 RepID=A0ABU2FJ68_9EURY|nr:rod-determining factor RdfA [Halomicroarcula sp. S3CR25-11]MDS0280805.1 hypothetical protein [Halomicroarcula sp. S3CR25-11]
MPSDDESPRNKVQSVIERRGLDGLEAELERRWEGDGFEEHSTRDLADAFNRTVLRDALNTVGEIPLDGEVENLHRLLTDDEVRSGNEMQARDRLAQHGLDADAVTSDFVSHQTMYRYLRDHRGVDTAPEATSTAELIERTRQSLLRLNSRTQSVVTQNVERLGGREGFTVGDFDIYVSVQLSCPDCGTTREVTQLLDQGGCGCQDDSTATRDAS